MYNWKPPKKPAVAENELGANFFSRWGQVLDQLFHSPLLKDLSSFTHKIKQESSENLFYINRNKGNKKKTDLNSKVDGKEVDPPEEHDKRQRADAAHGSKIHKPFTILLKKDSR